MNVLRRSTLVIALGLFACTEEAPPPAPTPAKPAAPASAPVAAAQPASAPVAKAPAGPRVVSSEGEVTVDGVPAKVDMAITATSVITTGKDSRMTFTLNPGSLIQVRPNSKVELGKSERKETSVKLALGAIWSFLPKGSNYEVVGPNAVAGARGTIFYVEATKPTETYVCDCDGEIELTSGKTTKTLKSEMKHVGANVKGADKKAKQAPTKKVLNHTKEEAEALEALRANL
jgi:hypothetical protein